MTLVCPEPLWQHKWGNGLFWSHKQLLSQPGTKVPAPRAAPDSAGIPCQQILPGSLRGTQPCQGGQVGHQAHNGYKLTEEIPSAGCGEIPFNFPQSFMATGSETLCTSA